MACTVYSASVEYEADGVRSELIWFGDGRLAGSIWFDQSESEQWQARKPYAPGYWMKERTLHASRDEAIAELLG